MKKTVVYKVNDLSKGHSQLMAPNQAPRECSTGSIKTQSFITAPDSSAFHLQLAPPPTAIQISHIILKTT